MFGTLEDMTFQDWWTSKGHEYFSESITTLQVTLYVKRKSGDAFEITVDALKRATSGRAVLIICQTIQDVDDIVANLENIKYAEKLNIKVDKVICTGYDTIDSNIIYGYLYKKKIIKSIKDSYHYYKSHHLMHAVKSYVSSGMQKALIIVADGRGSTYYLDNGEQGYETTSVYHVNNISDFKCIYKKYGIFCIFFRIFFRII
jgi:predicted NodU family carbamoyl transferase